MDAAYTTYGLLQPFFGVFICTESRIDVEQFCRTHHRRLYRQTEASPQFMGVRFSHSSSSSSNSVNPRRNMARRDPEQDTNRFDSQNQVQKTKYSGKDRFRRSFIDPQTERRSEQKFADKFFRESVKFPANLALWRMYVGNSAPQQRRR